MRFEVTQRFESNAEDVNRAYVDPDLYPNLVGLPKLGDIEVLDVTGDDDGMVIRARYQFTDPLPPAVLAVVDHDRLSWVQETTHDLTAGTADFVMIPDYYPDRVKARGRLVITADGDGARRVVRGEIKVKALLVAGRVEAVIVDGLREYLAAEAPAVDAYLAGDT